MPSAYRRINDSAGALRQQDRIRLGHYLEKIEKRISPVALSVYFPNITEPFILKQHSFWLFNQVVIQQADFAGRSEPLVPEWLFVLVIDIRTATAHFIWGYQLDPYVDVNRINSSIIKSRLLLRDGLLVQGIRKTMKDAARQIAGRVKTVHAHPERYGLAQSPKFAKAKGGEG